MFKYASTPALVLIFVTALSHAAFAQSAPQPLSSSAQAPFVELIGELLANPGQDDPNQTRLLFGPTGRSLKKGEVYFGVYEVLLPFVQVGVTDRLSVGAGTPLLFGFGKRPYWFTPKFKVMQRGNTAASVGALHFLNIGDDASIGVAYGAVSHGSPDSAITIGVGYAYSRWEADNYRADDQAGVAVAMLGGERRIAKGVKMVTENYLFTNGGFVSGGVRFFGDKLSADIGLMTPLTADDYVVLPIINVVRKF